MLSSAGSSSPANASSRRTISRCSVPIARAMACAAAPSSNSFSSKARVKVCTGPRPARWARLATAEESTPPERKTPSGTSDARWSRTHSSSAAAISSSPMGGAVPGVGRCQNSPPRTRRPSGESTWNSPGRSERMPSTAVRGPTTKPFQAIEAAAVGSRRGVPSSPEASSARTSEAKATVHPDLGSAEVATYSGLMPRGSRASSSVRRAGSQNASANIPRRAGSASSARWASTRRRTSASPVERTSSPAWRSSARSAA